jgi:hypothetical protein
VCRSLTKTPTPETGKLSSEGFNLRMLDESSSFLILISMSVRLFLKCTHYTLQHRRVRDTRHGFCLARAPKVNPEISEPKQDPTFFERKQYYEETCPRSSPFSTSAPRDKHVSAENRTRPACVTGEHSSKEPFKQLMLLLF